jgi:hypothetical protein
MEAIAMIDSEHLAKLLAHLRPDSFRRFLQDEFDYILAPAAPNQALRAQRRAMAAELAALTLAQRRRFEAVAEDITLLADAAGQEVMEGVCADELSPPALQAFTAQTNQYERALWLSLEQPALFLDALGARQADLFRQSSRCYSGFLAPTGLTLTETPAAWDQFRLKVAAVLRCQPNALAVQSFRRLRPSASSGTDVAIYQISLQHNRPPELVDYVEDRELVTRDLIRAQATYITYEPGSGHLEVLSKQAADREVLALRVAEDLLQSSFDGARIPLKQYDYQSLAAPRTFDLNGEDDIAWVKVTELGIADPQHRSLLLKIRAKQDEDIYTAARELIGPTFDFRDHRLTYAKLTIRLKKEGRQRARTITIVLRGDNLCNIKTKREKDRLLCDRLLVKWYLLQELRHGWTPDPLRLAA